MADGRLLTTADLGALFTREMTALGGAVKDVYDDGNECTDDICKNGAPQNNSKAGMV